MTIIYCCVMLLYQESVTYREKQEGDFFLGFKFNGKQSITKLIDKHRLTVKIQFLAGFILLCFTAKGDENKQSDLRMDY